MLLKTIHGFSSQIFLVSAIGHAAMLAAIKKYTPSLIPSPYSSERLNVAKQLERTKKMEVQSWGNLEDPSRISS
ncbi:hypothetical protein EZV62_003861 [Acer yangbiense]|uniref:Uncharacterized protein n=1 Tax=Acer yangbiense TaxID=1000413 RepID=A0A5C7IKE1_9ROSI|nr:hypothetical protein EZV62_003861 [Acer yangbiense]